ncbi:hypothetical protein R3P38DRAFT_2372241, partial [Favolaschia claudopus]
GAAAAFRLIQSEITSRALMFSAPLTTPLVFSYNPPDHGAYDTAHQAQLLPNTGRYRLKSTAPANTIFLEHENRFWELLGLLHVLPPCSQKTGLERALFQELEHCSKEKERHWNQQRLAVEIQQVVVHNVNFIPITEREPHTLVPLIVTAMMTQLYHVPRIGGTVLLAGFRDFIRTLPESLSYELPKDPRTVIKQLRLDPVTESYVCCPKCWALSPIVNPITSSHPDPEIPLCQDHLPGDEVCGAELWKKEKLRDRIHCKPKLIYVHQLVKHWLGKLLSRPGIEDILDSYPLKASGGEEGHMADIWSSPAIRALKGPDGKSFLDAPIGEGRYLFSIAVDGFNPFHNKEAKQVVTSTGFFLVLMNFPPHMRY